MILSRLVRDIAGDQNFLTIEYTGECQGISRTIRGTEVLAISRDLAIVHSSESQWLLTAHDVRDPSDLLIDSAAGVQQIPARNRFVEHRLAHFIVAILAGEALLVVLSRPVKSQFPIILKKVTCPLNNRDYAGAVSSRGHLLVSVSP